MFSFSYIKAELILSIIIFPHLCFAQGQTQQVGDLLQVAIPVIALGTTLTHDNETAGAKQLFKAMVVTQVSTIALKQITHERRPNGHCCDSFPSAHTAMAFTGASFIHKRYGLKYAIPAYVAATYVGYSRVHVKAHYTKDVLAGAALGAASSFYFTKPYKGFSVEPTAYRGGGLGVSLSKTW